MSKPHFYTKFPDLDDARNKIQREATCFDDIVKWVKDNPWYFVAYQLKAHQNVWSHYRQQNFYRAHKDFSLTLFTIESTRNGHSPISGWHDTNVTFMHLKFDAKDNIDVYDGLNSLGLGGSGGVHNSSDSRFGNLGVKLRASAWFYLSRQCILESIGSSVWDYQKSGAARWYPDADLNNLHQQLYALSSALAAPRKLWVSQVENRLDGKIPASIKPVDLPDMAIE